MAVPQKLSPLTQHQGLRQFVKFGIVGLSSTVINFVVFNVLYRKLHLQLVPALTAAFILSVINGFYWNRKWTFKQARSGSASSQGVKFLIVNIVGWILNTSIVVLVIAHFTSSRHGGIFGDPDHFKQIVAAVVAGQGKTQYGFWLVNGALAAATCVVVFWNFFANRLWTFKH